MLFNCEQWIGMKACLISRDMMDIAACDLQQ